MELNFIDQLFLVFFYKSNEARSSILREIHWNTETESNELVSATSRLQTERVASDVENARPDLTLVRPPEFPPPNYHLQVQQVQHQASKTPMEVTEDNIWLAVTTIITNLFPITTMQLMLVSTLMEVSTEAGICLPNHLPQHWEADLQQRNLVWPPLPTNNPEATFNYLVFEKIGLLEDN